MKTVSVIIATYNRADAVVRCVESVLANDYESMEVIVVNDCSPDHTVKLLREKFGNDERVVLITNERNMQLAGSQNRGASVAKGEYLFFVDDDNVLDSSAIAELAKQMDVHEEYGLLAPVAVHKTGDKAGRIWTLGSDFNRWTSQPADFLPNLPIEEFKPDREIYETTYSPNAFMIRREALVDVGGKEESFGIMFEESDLGWRICKRGWKAGICANARTDHYGVVEEGCSAQLRRLGIEKPRRAYFFGRNRLWFAKRHFSFLQVLSVMFVFAPLSALYYGVVAVKSHRFDIAKAYLFGTVAGLFTRAGMRKIVSNAEVV